MPTGGGGGGPNAWATVALGALAATLSIPAIASVVSAFRNIACGLGRCWGTKIRSLIGSSMACVSIFLFLFFVGCVLGAIPIATAVLRSVEAVIRLAPPPVEVS